MNPIAAVALGGVLAAGCGAGPPDVDGPVDAATAPDAGPSAPDAAPGADSSARPDAGPAPADAGAPDAAPPPPPFTVSGDTAGMLALTDHGVLPTFSFDGEPYDSFVRLLLRAEDSPDTCSVRLRPMFVRFDTGATNARAFATAILDVGAGTIEDNDCGWEDDVILSGLATLGTIEVGFAQALIEEDRPNLDVFLDRSWPLPGGVDDVLLPGAGFGFPMDSGGVVDSNGMVEPAPGTLARGLYLW